MFHDPEGFAFGIGQDPSEAGKSGAIAKRARKLARISAAAYRKGMEQKRRQLEKEREEAEAEARLERAERASEQVRRDALQRVAGLGGLSHADREQWLWVQALREAQAIEQALSDEPERPATPSHDWFWREVDAWRTGPSQKRRSYLIPSVANTLGTKYRREP